MRIFLDHAFNFFLHSPQKWIDVEVEDPVLLRTLIEQAGIPSGEVHMASLNGMAVTSLDVWVTANDHIKIFPPFGGG